MRTESGAPLAGVPSSVPSSVPWCPLLVSLLVEDADAPRCLFCSAVHGTTRIDEADQGAWTRIDEADEGAWTRIDEADEGAWTRIEEAAHKRGRRAECK
jgi:hypothetical protein